MREAKEELQKELV